MSFDTVFDYTLPKNYLNGRITDFNNDLTTVNGELVILGNLSNTYQSMCSRRMDYLNNKKGALETTLNKLANVVVEITTIETLPSDSKNTLYEFYTTYIKPRKLEFKKEYMARIMFNSTQIVSNANVLLNDGNITSDEANCVIQLIREYNPIKRESSSVLKSIKDIEY